MAEPQVQYAKTSDGVNIAFASMGEGPPLIRLAQPGAAHVQRDWTMFPGIVPPLPRTFRLISYDPRGTGLSDRDETDFSMEAMMRDLEAVIDRTGLQSFAVLALQDSVPIAEDDDLYGTAVNLAARIAAQAEGGEILASEAVKQIVAGKKFPFSDRGETTLRGFEDRVHIYQVSWREGD